ncbi:hypothetical protein GUJ93_ZPchr0004g38131 [Zizania palustris]|uniref:Uncharacterized protein n=1 Tax=Zizania palustris TaxID=103762 RepID=A0A8J5SIP6_ZIZPA|nr:hypothetical protein GUJ93_ZPchr0004g38131 [Zizania palustris]
MSMVGRRHHGYDADGGDMSMVAVSMPGQELALTNCAYVSSADLCRVPNALALVGGVCERALERRDGLVRGGETENAREGWGRRGTRGRPRRRNRQPPRATDRHKYDKFDRKHHRGHVSPPSLLHLRQLQQLCILHGVYLGAG